ncbi:MAG: hypothetical protein HN379_01630 [Desulfobacteraceae bacterium]|jgi:hypothetical protein|nr:hypothetical protein [Desulfobacteraceae bacterium]MBT4363887.1 hypothetical protein [Desulfobacteraceae bacterium]
MDNPLNEDSWVWVMIQNPGENEQLLGQIEEETDTSFIPTFVGKEEALKCYGLLARENNIKYEAQAIIYEDLVNHASNNGFMIFLLDSEGKILKKIKP